MKTQNKKDQYMQYIVLTLFSMALLVLSVWLLLKLGLTVDWNNSWFSKADYTGNVGDFFSGTIGVFLSFVSTLLVVFTLWEQRKQFELAQDEQRQNRFEMTYYNFLAMLDKTRESVNNVLKIHSKVKNLDTIIDCYTIFSSYYIETRSEIYLKGDCTDAEIDNKREEMASLYETFVDDYGCKISYYYRYIYHVLMFVIDEYGSDIDGAKKISKYLNILQSQLSDEEMALLFYSSFS